MESAEGAAQVEPAASEARALRPHAHEPLALRAEPGPLFASLSVMMKPWFSLSWIAVASVLAPACAGSSDDGDDSVEMAESSALTERALTPVQPAELACGGLAGRACPMGFKCIPNQPFCSDCFGTCALDFTLLYCSDRHRPSAYVSRDPRDCARIRFVCRQGERSFSDVCGCGCDKIAR